MGLDALSQALEMVGEISEFTCAQYQELINRICYECCMREEDAKRYIDSLIVFDEYKEDFLQALKEISDLTECCDNGTFTTKVLERHPRIGFWSKAIVLGHKAIVGNDGYGSGFK